MKNFILRTLSGAVYVALIVVAILLLDNSPIAYLCLISAFIAVGIHEIYTMTRKEGSESWMVFIIDALGGISTFISFYFMSTEEQSTHGLWLIPLATYLIARCIVQLYRPQQNAVHSLERSFFAMLYIVMPLSMLSSISSITSPRMLLVIFCFIWLNDTGAFLTGITLGRHKLFERVSPKKSWEGFIGGVAFCIAAAYAFYYVKLLNDFLQVPDLRVTVILSVIVSLAATFGDFTESLLKRTLEVKDSGNLIPGHGGILDRIDSLLLVAPAALIFLALVVYNNILTL